MRKQAKSLILACAILAMASATSAAIRVYVDDLETRIKPAPVIKNGKAYVGLRAVACALGASTRWDAGSKTAIITAGNKRARVPQSSGIMIRGVLFLPLRATGEAVGCTVEWDSAQRAINIVTEDPAPRGGG